MATYYRWRQSNIEYTPVEGPELTQENLFTFVGNISEASPYTLNYGQGYSVESDGSLALTNPRTAKLYYSTSTYQIINMDGNEVYLDLPHQGDHVLHKCEPALNGSEGYVVVAAKNSRSPSAWVFASSVKEFTVEASKGSSIGYVYSTNSSAYPNGGKSGSYYYDQRTTVTSPTIPTGLTYPATITTPSVSVSWTAATSATDYPVSLYEVSYSTNGGSGWTIAGTTAETSYSFDIPAGATSILFRVRAKDSNNQYGAYVTGTASQVLLSPTLTVPQMVMQGQQATVSWTSIDGADSYTLQRKSNTDTDWTQVYSGTALTFSETVGTWTSLQYRVQAVFDGTPGGWATSNSIQIVSASSLVISGQDGDLGTLTSDVLYTISSDQTSPTIDVTVEVNGGEYASFQATSGQTYKVGVLDLPTGTGNITITATTEVSSSPVTVTRNWTYSKTAQTFPNSGSVAALTKEGNVVYPETLPEAVRTPMNPWGGNLGTALNLLKNAALFNRTKRPKYSEVTISMANVTEGQIIRIPRGGVMVPHYVGKLEYETSLNGTGRRLLVPVECYNKRQWNTTDVATYATSAIDSWMNGEYKALFPEEIQTAMGTTKFYYTQNAVSDVTTLERSVFALSANELGKSAVWFNAEGSVLPIASALQIAKYNGSAIEQWTRTPTNNALTAVCLLSNGNANGNYCTDALGSRPCFTLPSTYTYGPVYVDQDGNIHDQQEYTEAGNWLDVWGNAIPAVKIETGSYVGTGTSGESNPNTLTFSFVPKFVFICGETTTPMQPGGGGASHIQAAFLVYNNPKCIRVGNGVGTLGNVQWEGNSVSWYSENLNSAPFYQLNTSGITYDYVAIG